MKRKLNQKSLYQEGGAMSSTNSANNTGSLAQDIQSQMQLGVSPYMIYRDMLVSYLPADEISAAFQELGYSQDDVSDLYEQVVEMMNEEQQSSESTMQEAQFGGWVNAPNSYLPMDLGRKGDPLNAALFAGKAVMDLVGGKDRDGDGFKDGAWRDLGPKRKAFKNFKNQKLQSFIPDTTSDTIDDKVGPNINSDDYDPEFEVENYLKRAQDEEKNRLYFNEPDFPVTSTRTSAITPKSTTAPTTTSKQTPVDYTYLDPAISQMLDFESKSGGYDPSMGAYGLTNLGANRYMMGLNSLNINSPTFRTDLTERIKQDYGSSLAGFAQEAQPAMLDYAYNTGRDPRIYMLDAYLKGQGQSGLPNRGAYKDAMQDYTWTDKNLEQQFNTEYDKYKDAIGNLSGQDQLRLMNEGRKFYYNNINQVNGQPNPAAQATWLQRPFYKSGGSLPKYKIQGEVLPEVTVTPFDNVMPNMPQTFDTIAPDFSGFEDINKNNIPDYLERNDPAKNQMGTQGVQGPQLPPDPFDNVQADVSTDTTDEDLPMYGRNPFGEAFKKTSNASVAVANLANEFFQNKKASDAEQDFIYSTMADKIYGAYNERPGSRGMWDVNTGLAQPDNLDVGYARMGMEMSPKLNMLRMFTGGGMVYNDMYMPEYQVGGEAQVDNQTLAALIAAGADIEIL